MTKKIINRDGRLLQGRWESHTFQEAQEGVIFHRIKEYMRNREEGFELIGIASHNKTDGFDYFLGESHEAGSLDLPNYYCLVITDFLAPYETYLKLAHEDYSFQELFDSSRKFDPIPTKIEYYVKRNQTIELLRIELPIIRRGENDLWNNLNM